MLATPILYRRHALAHRNAHLSVAKQQRGFSLIEMAIVMVILGLLLGGLIMPLSTQRDLNNRKATEKQLAEIHDALLGFAASNGRLPCPATDDSNGLALPATATNNCTEEHGFVPARTLGLNGSFTNTNLLKDAWNNPVRYSLSSVGSWSYANNITFATAAANYRICRQRACAAADILAENVVAVVFSQGRDGSPTIPPTSPDQLENTDSDNDFVLRTPSEATNAEFDDILHWISPNTLTLSLLRAGQLDES